MRLSLLYMDWIGGTDGLSESMHFSPAPVQSTVPTLSWRNRSSSLVKLMLAPPQDDVGVPSEQQQEEDVALQNLSRMLMEEEEDGRLSCQYHPALLHVELSFAHLISSSPSSSDGETLISTDQAEAPDTTFSGRRPRKKNLHSRWDELELEEGAGRASKVTATAGPQEEAVGLQEMIDRMMLSDCEISSQEMADLRAAVEEKARRPEQQQEVVVDLRTLLLHSARAVADGRGGARELLEQIKMHASPDGDSTQRLARCFAEALEARLAGTTTLRTSSSRSLMMTAEFLGAYRLFMATCCFKKVAFMFANRTICRAAAGRSRLHIVDYGLGLGFQWPSLLRRMAARDRGPPSVTLTGVDLPEPGFRPAAHVEETGRRLSACARALGVPFQFRAVASATWADAVRTEDLTRNDDVALVVNSLFSLESLLDDSVVVDGQPSPRDALLERVRAMRPAVFTHGVVNGCYGSTFAMRFREALFNYSAVFDALGATMPSGSAQRRVLERDCLGPCVLDAVAREGPDRTDRFDTYRQWQLRMRRAGLRQLPLDRAVVGAVREMVKRQQYHKDFVVDEDQRWLLQGWKGRVLYAHSSWVADDSA